MLEAYADESCTETPPLFVMAGYLATPAQWSAFNAKWATAIRSMNIRFFKMKKAMRWEPSLRFERLSQLHDIIEDHVSFKFALAVDQKMLSSVMSDWHDQYFREPFYFCLFNVVTHLIHATDEQVRFVFDDHSKKEKIKAEWNGFMADAPRNARSRVIGEPAFENDKRVPPLQAADLLAWWARTKVLAALHGTPTPPKPWRTRAGVTRNFYFHFTKEWLVKYRAHHAAGILPSFVANPDGSVTIMFGGVGLTTRPLNKP